MKTRVYLPKEDACLWLDCINKGYNQFAGYCPTHHKRGLLLGDNKQCSYYDKGGYCLIETKEMFNKKHYCLVHKELLIEYEKTIKELEKTKGIENKHNHK